MKRNQGLISLLVLLAAGAALVGSFLIPTTPIPGGGRTLEGFALVVLGLAILPQLARRRLSPAGALLTSLLVLSCGAWAALTKPTWLFYLELRPFELAEPKGFISLAVILIQGLVVLWQIGVERQAFRAILKTLGPRLWLLSFLALLVSACQLTLIYPHRQETRFLIYAAAQMIAVAGMVLVNGAHLALVALKLPLDSSTRLDSAPTSRKTWLARLRPHCAWLAGLWVFGVAALTSYFVLDRVPHLPDGLAYLFQAKTIAGGSFSAPAPAFPAAFELYLIDFRDGQWFAVTNPGYPLLLALGVKLGLPWLVNPILGGLTTWLSHGLLRRLMDRRRADIGVLILALSPWMLFLSASFMTHVATQFFIVLGAIATLDAGRAGRTDKAFLAGAAFGFVCLIRPLDGVLVGLVAGLYLLWRIVKLRALRWRVLMAFSAAAVLICATLLVFFFAITGSATDAPINSYIAELWPDSSNRLGFGAEVGNPPQAWGPLDPIPGHGWRDVLLNTNQNLANLQMELFGLPIGSLCFILFLMGQRSWSRELRWTLGILLLLILGYNLYWFSGGPDFGPRYWFSMLIPLLYLSVLGIEALVQTATTAGAQTRVRAAILLVFLTAGPVFFAWRICGRYLDYRNFHGGYRELLAENEELQGGLVFVNTPDEIDYGCAFILNDPFLSPESTVFARDRGPEANLRLMISMKSRRIFYVDGRAITGQAPSLVSFRKD